MTDGNSSWLDNRIKSNRDQMKQLPKGLARMAGYEGKSLIEEQAEEIKKLQHDIERYIAVSVEQAAEIKKLEEANAVLVYAVEKTTDRTQNKNCGARMDTKTWDVIDKLQEALAKAKQVLEG